MVKDVRGPGEIFDKRLHFQGGKKDVARLFQSINDMKRSGIIYIGLMGKWSLEIKNNYLILELKTRILQV